jgi:hypothetical protein
MSVRVENENRKEEESGCILKAYLKLVLQE